MQEIKAIVQPFLVDALKETPRLPGVTVSGVRGFGKSQADGGNQNVVEDSLGFSKKAKIERCAG